MIVSVCVAAVKPVCGFNKLISDKLLIVGLMTMVPAVVLMSDVDMDSGFLINMAVFVVGHDEGWMTLFVLF